jgi:hypothetical protein
MRSSGCYQVSKVLGKGAVCDELTVSFTEPGIKMALLRACIAARGRSLAAGHVLNRRADARGGGVGRRSVPVAVREPLRVCHCRATKRNIGRVSTGNACGVKSGSAVGAVHEVRTRSWPARLTSTSRNFGMSKPRAACARSGKGDRRQTTRPLLTYPCNEHLRPFVLFASSWVDNGPPSSDSASADDTFPLPAWPRLPPPCADARTTTHTSISYFPSDAPVLDDPILATAVRLVS